MKTIEEYIDRGNYKLVSISDEEMNNYVILTIDQFDQILSTQTGDIVTINGVAFPRKELEKVNVEARKEVDDLYESRNKSGNVPIYVVSGVVILGLAIAAFRDNTYFVKSYR